MQILDRYLPIAIEFERFELLDAATRSLRNRRSSNSFCAKSDLLAMLCLQEGVSILSSGGKKIAECLYIVYGLYFFYRQERKECYVSWGMLCIFSSWWGSFRVGWGGKSSPKQSNWVLKIYPQWLTWTLDLTPSFWRLCVLAFILIQAMLEVSNVFYFKLLHEELSSFSFLFFSFFSSFFSFYILCSLFATCPWKGLHILCFTTYFMMTQGRWGNSRCMVKWHLSMVYTFTWCCNLCTHATLDVAAIYSLIESMECLRNFVCQGIILRAMWTLRERERERETISFT